MEDGLVLQMRYLPISSWFCLNPCCNGRWSRTATMCFFACGQVSLNPCCNGRWSRTVLTELNKARKACLNPCCNGRWSRTYVQIQARTLHKVVLILVVMEDGLVPEVRNTYFGAKLCLNPCCNGRWSRTTSKACF